MTKKFILGIPSFNEADVIQRVTQQCDICLSNLGMSQHFIIANADNNSPDGTSDIFARTRTKTQKMSINNTAKGMGVNIKSLSKLTVEEGFSGLIIFDADISTISPTWIQQFVDGLQQGADVVFSRRQPTWNRGDLTYHLCSPAIAAITGARIREPISPTKTYSRKVLEAVLQYSWDNDLHGFGVDFFMSTVATQFNWKEVFMPTALQHKLRSYTSTTQKKIIVGNKYQEVLRTVRKLGLNKPLHASASECLEGSNYFTYATVPYDVELEGIANRTHQQLSILCDADPLLQQTLKQSMGQEFSNYFNKGLSWSAWKIILRAWINNPEFPLTAAHMELLLLSRCVGFYRENLGQDSWYKNVECQIDDFLLNNKIGTSV